MSDPTGTSHNRGTVCEEMLRTPCRVSFTTEKNVLKSGADTPSEGTGTWPDYLVNRDEQKKEGPFGEKNCTHSRNTCMVNGRCCG